MSRQIWKIALCLLAVGPSVHAQQSGSRRVFKIGGATLTQSAERLTAPHQRGGVLSSSVDTSQAVAPVRTSGASESVSVPRQDAGAVAEPTFADRQRDDAIKLAEKRVEFARQQVADLERYNRWAPPQAQPPMAVRMLPHSMSYSPVSVADPVQSFVPRSTFAHVFEASEREQMDAELQLATLVAERDASATTGDSPGQVQTSGDTSDDAARLAYVEASLQRERFLTESAERRLTQLSNLSALTYSEIYPTLYRKLELERLGHELAAKSFEHEKDTLVNSASDR